MAAKDLKNTQRFKQLAPALVAGASIVGSAGAVAGFTALIHDENYSAVYKVDSITQDSSGLTIVLANDPSPLPDPDTCMSNYNNDTDTLVIENADGDTLAGCELDNVTLNAAGDMVIEARDCFDKTDDQVCQKSYSCEPADWGDASSEDKLFVLNLRDKDGNAYADDCKLTPEDRVRAIFVGNVDVTDTVQFLTTKGGSISINPPFSIASGSDAHRFTFSATTTSGS